MSSAAVHVIRFRNLTTRSVPVNSVIRRRHPVKIHEEGYKSLPHDHQQSNQIISSGIPASPHRNTAHCVSTSALDLPFSARIRGFHVLHPAVRFLEPRLSTRWNSTHTTTPTQNRVVIGMRKAPSSAGSCGGRGLGSLPAGRWRQRQRL